MRISPAALLALASLPTAAQDTLAPGFELSPEPNPSPSVLALSTTLAGGDIVVFDGLDVVQYAADGTFLETLGSLGAAVFPSFVLADPDENQLFVGESSNGHVYRLFVGLHTTPEWLATLPLNYDAAMLDASELYVSAATCGFNCGNEIWRVDVATRQTVLVALVPGASGPLAFDAGGQLFYGTASAAWPPPPASSAVVAWSRAQLQGSLPLDLFDARLVADGFAGASRLAYDRRSDALFLAINNFATGENRVARVLGSAAQSPIVVEGRPFRTLGNLSVPRGEGRARFLPYQPAAGGTLVYTSTDFSAPGERFAVRPRRATASFSGPGTVGAGEVVLSLENGPPNGFARVLFCPLASFHADERVFRLGALPLFLGLELDTVFSVPALLPLDAAGALQWSFTNPGGLQGLFATQLLLLDPGRELAATSTAAFL